MRIELKETSLDLIPLTKEYIHKKLQPLGRFVKRYEQHAEVRMFVEIAKTTKHHQKGNVFYAEITMELPKSIIRAEATNVDVRTALDQVRDIVKRECQQYKEKYVIGARKNGSKNSP